MVCSYRSDKCGGPGISCAGLPGGCLIFWYICTFVSKAYFLSCLNSFTGYILTTLLERSGSTPLSDHGLMSVLAGGY